MHDVAFELDEANRRSVCKLPDGLDYYRVALKSATELQFQALLRDVKGVSARTEILAGARPVTRVSAPNISPPPPSAGTTPVIPA